MREARWYPVVAVATLSYRKSLRHRQAFDLETRALAARDRAILQEQRFVVGGEIYARGYVKVRVLKSEGGSASAEELTSLIGDDLTELPLDDWMLRWVDDIALPPTRTAAPSVWDPA